MAVVIPESDMQFGVYEEEQVFQLILRRDNKLYFIEAKKSCPRQIEASTSEEKKAKYREYIHDIAVKMRHSLALYSNILLERYDAEGISDLLREKNLSELEIRLVLVVKNAEKGWLVPFEDVFRREFRDELKIWNIPIFYVINEETARSKHFII